MQESDPEVIYRSLVVVGNLVRSLRVSGSVLLTVDTVAFAQRHWRYDYLVD